MNWKRKFVRNWGRLGMKCKRYALSELAEIKYGKNQKKVLSEDGNIPIYGTGGLFGYATTALYDKPSVLIGRKGTIRKVKYVEHPFWTVDTLFYTIINTDIVIPKYLYYVMSLIDFNNYDEGTTIPSLRTETLNRLEFDIPSKEEQEIVLSCLNPIDEKVELNNAINNNLEQQAITFYKHWFKKFQPFGGNKPDGWHLKPLGDMCDCLLGGTPSRNKPEYWNGTVPWINSGKINEFRVVEPSEYITNLGLTKSATKLLPAKTTVLAITGATLGQVSLLEIESCANQSVIGITPNKTLPYEFIYPLIKDCIHELISHQTGGAQQHINKQNVEELMITIPDQYTMNKYVSSVSGMYSKIANNCFENLHLNSLRNTLLPKLMSGELDFSKIEL